LATTNKPKYLEWGAKEKLTLLTGWAREGLSNEQLAKNMGINPCTLYNWMKKPECVKIVEAIKKGKEVSDFEVENALYKSALGFVYEEEVTESKLDKNGEKVIYVRREKRVAQPNVAAIIFWLKNRKPNKWKDKQIQEISQDALVNAKEVLVKIKKASEEFVQNNQTEKTDG